MGATLPRMKLWDVSTKQETHQVAMALTVVEAWELRDCLDEMLGLERSGEPSRIGKHHQARTVLLA